MSSPVIIETIIVFEDTRVRQGSAPMSLFDVQFADNGQDLMISDSATVPHGTLSLQ
jgi:hypothetical protein